MFVVRLFSPFDEDVNFQIIEYKSDTDDRTALNRITSEEKKALDSSYLEIYKDFR